MAVRSARLPSLERLAAPAIVLAVLSALLLLALAVARYPGGNDLDRRAPGFDLARNYLSDLLHERALDGRRNPAAPLARGAMLAFMAGLPPFYVALARLARSRAVLVAGLLSAAVGVAVPLTPSDAFGPWHAAAILLSVAPGLVACVTAVVGLSGTRPRLALAGAGALTLAAVTVAFYVPLLAGAVEVSLAVPVLQKVAGASFMGWMLATAAAAGGAAP